MGRIFVMLSGTVTFHPHCILNCHPLQFYVPPLETSKQQQQRHLIKEMLLASSALAVVPSFFFYYQSFLWGREELHFAPLHSCTHSATKLNIFF